MYILLGLLSTFGYALQFALMSKFARKGDALSFAVYRSLSLGVSMLPILFFAGWENFQQILFQYQIELLISSFCIIFNVWILFEAYKYLPIGIGSGIRSVGSISITIIISWIVFDEVLHQEIIVFIAIMLIGSFILSAYRSNFNHLDSRYFARGFIFAIISGLLSSIAIATMVDVSRNVDPFLAAYFWELEAGIVGLVVLFLRKITTGKGFEKISVRDFGKILFAASPTLIGTLCFSLAVLQGPVGIVSAIGSLGILFGVIFGIFLFDEKLKGIQYLGIFCIILGIIGIKIYG